MLPAERHRRARHGADGHHETGQVHRQSCRGPYVTTDSELEVDELIDRAEKYENQGEDHSEGGRLDDEPDGSVLFEPRGDERSAPKEHEAGASVPELFRRHGVVENTIYRWKSKFGEMEVWTSDVPVQPK